MNAAAGFLVLMQVWSVVPAQVTIGDTVVLERDIEVADPGARLQLTPIEPSPLMEPLAPPRIIGGAGGFVARYVVAMFEPGSHEVRMPDPELVYPDGRVETRVGGAAYVTVTSVLPDSDSLPPPKESREPVPRYVAQPVLAMLLVSGVLALSIAWGLVRRRPARRPAWAAAEVEEPEVAVSRWIAAGEPRAVATFTAHRIREATRRRIPEANPSLDLETWLRVVQTHRPDWPLRELSEIMRALERACFAPAIPSDVIALADDASVLEETIDKLETVARDVEAEE
jgi:hypothetical protein